jgi:hypothetical protein
MSNVLQLHIKNKIEHPSVPKAIVMVTVADILASNAQLAHTIKELSVHLDAVDHAIDGVSDTDAQNRLKQVAKPARDRLTNAMLGLSEAVRMLAVLQLDLLKTVG